MGCTRDLWSTSLGACENSASHTCLAVFTFHSSISADTVMRRVLAESQKYCSPVPFGLACCTLSASKRTCRQHASSPVTHSIRMIE